MVLQLLILWDENDYYRRFNLPFDVSILFKTLQVLVASVPHSVLVYIYIHLIFCRNTTQWGHGFYRAFSNSLGMKVTKTYRKYCALYWDVYIICNILVLYLINCVTTKNELIGMFVSLGSEVAEGSILSRRIIQVLVNSVEWHKVNTSCKFRIDTWNNSLSTWNNWLSA
jgi:hypothetical protein